MSNYFELLLSLQKFWFDTHPCIQHLCFVVDPAVPTCVPEGRSMLSLSDLLQTSSLQTGLGKQNPLWEIKGSDSPGKRDVLKDSFT